LGNLVSSISSGIRGVDDFKSGPGGITTMMGPAGIFSLNPRDSVLATTNPIPVNDMQIGPAGSMSPTNSNVNVNLTGVVQGDTVRFLTDVPFDGSNSSTETLATRG
jgi:hypothetical protein